MTTFDRHIIRRLSVSLFVLLMVLTTVFLLLHYLEYIDDFLDHDAKEQEVVWRYYPSLIPDILRQIAPAAMFLSVIFLTGRLAQELQLTALYTSGVSMYRILRPFLLTGAVFTGFMFYLNGWIVPQTNTFRIGFEAKYLNRGNEKLEGDGPQFRQLGANVMLNVNQYSASSQTAYTVCLLRYNVRKQVSSRIDADQMKWLSKSKKWRLVNPVITTLNPDSSLSIQRRTTPLDTALASLPNDLSRTVNDVQLLTIQDAHQYIQELKRSGVAELGIPEVDYFAKFTYPFANLLVVIAGFSLASTRRKGGQAMQMAIGLMVAFVYLAVIKVTEPFGYAGELNPVWATSLPHLLFLAVGLVLMWRARK